jgi:hypothetical protein
MGTGLPKVGGGQNDGGGLHHHGVAGLISSSLAVTKAVSAACLAPEQLAIPWSPPRRWECRPGAKTRLEPITPQ